MLYLDTFGASGGLGRCTIELLPLLAQRLGSVVLAGQSHVVDSYRGQLAATDALRFWNLEQPYFHPSALKLRVMAKVCPESTSFTETFLNRSGVHSTNSGRVLINYPQAIAPPQKAYEFDTFIHDLNWRHFPGNFSDPETVDRRCAQWMRKSRHIFSNSDFTRQEVIQAYGIDSRQVISAPLAPPSTPFVFPEQEKQATLQRAGLQPDGFFFYPSAHGLHKGHDVLAAALESCGATPICPVVITARIDDSNEGSSPEQRNFLNAVKSKLRALEASGKIISLPGLPWPELMLIASACRAYLLPSKFEGFGFPLVEAMALHRPSICSDIPAFREIIARYDAQIQTVTFPVGHAEALRELIIETSRKNIFAESFKAPSDNSSVGWSWDDTAKAITDAL